MGASWADHKSKKIIIIIALKCCLLLFYTTRNHFSIRLWDVWHRGLYTTTIDEQLSWTEKKRQSTSQSQVKVKVAQSCPTLCDAMDYVVHGILKARILEWVAFPFSRGSSQARDQTQVSCVPGRFFTHWATREDKFAPKNVMVIVWWSTAFWSTIAFWIWQNHYICEVGLANQWDAPKTAMPAAGTGQQKGPNSSPWQWLTACCTINAFKVEWIGLWSFASSSIFTWPLTNWLPLLQASQQFFTGKMLPQPAGGRKCFPRVRRLPKHGFLLYRNKQTYFSLAKICWL